EQHTIPAQEILCWLVKLVITLPGWQVCKTPVRCLSFAVDAKARPRGLHGETVVHQLAKPVRDVIRTATTQILPGIALAQKDAAVVVIFEGETHVQRREQCPRTKGQLLIGRRA